MKLYLETDCGNSPRKLFIRDFNLAFAEVDHAFVLGHLAEDIRWDIVGDRVIEGKPAVREHLKTMMGAKADALYLEQMITHGKTAAANGKLHYGKEIYAFCDLFTFTSAGKNMIRSLISFAVRIS